MYTYSNNCHMNWYILKLFRIWHEKIESCTIVTSCILWKHQNVLVFTRWLILHEYYNYRVSVSNVKYEHKVWLGRQFHTINNSFIVFVIPWNCSQVLYEIKSWYLDLQHNVNFLIGKQVFEPLSLTCKIALTILCRSIC